MMKKRKRRETGRPRIIINWDEFDKLCLIQCTQREIATWFSCSVDTIDRHVRRDKKMAFADYWQEKAGRGKMAVRRKQYELAVAGNIPMLIWWGKNNMDQADKREEKQSVTLESTTDEIKKAEIVALITQMMDDLKGCQTPSQIPSSAPELGLLPH